jgi:chromosomal replication initiator protein
VIKDVKIVDNMLIDYPQIWKKTLAQIEIRLNDESSFNRYFKFSTLQGIEDGNALIGTSGSFISQIINTRYKSLLVDILSQNYGKKIGVKFQVNSEMSELAQKNNKQVLSEADLSPLLNSTVEVDESALHRIEKAGLNPKFSFTNFVLGDSNRFAHAASLAITKSNSHHLNPFFIYGKTGLGKTHLAQSIGRAILESDFSKRVLYVPSETFLNDLVSAIRTNKTLEFRKKYRELDCLIIDDIQMISRWVETQSEFFNTFNALNLANKQVILISDRPPEEIEKLEDRIRSRFQGGITANIVEPELETRYAILLQKQKELGTSVPHQTLRNIARLVSTNVRELEGALSKVSLMQSIRPDYEMSFVEIESFLGKIPSIEKRKNLKASEIIKIICDHYEVKLSDIKGSGRTANLNHPRQICMYILNKEFGFKLEEIARQLGRKDHTTVMHAKNKIQEKIEKEPEFSKEIEILIKKILK